MFSFASMLLRISPHSVRMRENTDQNNFDYGHFSRSVLESNVINDSIGTKWIKLGSK